MEPRLNIRDLVRLRMLYSAFTSYQAMREILHYASFTPRQSQPLQIAMI